MLVLYKDIVRAIWDSAKLIIIGNIKIVCYCMFKIFLMFEDRFIDNKYCVKTCGICKPTISDAMFDDSVYYEATSYRHLMKVIDYLNMDQNDHFIDIGCGMGRVLFYTATKKIKKIVGVEIDSGLYAAAQSNLKYFNAGHTKIEIYNCDAANYDISLGTVIFMFNPFGWKTLSIVLENIKKSLIKVPRKITIVYINPKYSLLLDSSDWLVKDDTKFRRMGSVVWRSV